MAKGLWTNGKVIPYEGPEVEWDADAPLSRAAGHGREGRAETTRSNAALAIYAAMGVNRSFVKLHELFVAQKQGGGKPPSTSLSTISSWSARYSWQERAQRYDILEHEASLREMAQERQDERRRRIILLRGLRAKVTNAVTEMLPEEAKWSDVIAGVRMLTEQMRIEFGDDLQQHSVTVRRGAEMDDVSDADLDAIIQNLLGVWRAEEE